MMRLARRASLVVVLLLLASVGTASAECAWVLWVDTLSPTHATSTKPIRAYNTKPECDDALTFAVDSFTGGPVVLKRRQEVYVTGGSKPIVHRYVCLPDTIDPRGPEARPDGRLAAPGAYECKWVLWVDDYVLYGEERRGTPKRYGTYANDATCKAIEAAAPRLPDTEQRLRRMAQDMTFVESKRARLVFTRVDSNSQAMLFPAPGDGPARPIVGTTFQCLPDTVDPRGPKGK